MNLEPLKLTAYLAHFLKQHRATFGTSQRQLAEQVGLTQAAIAALEAGTANPTLATIEKIAAGLHAEASLTFKARRH